MRLVISILFLLVSSNLFGQEKGSVLVIADFNSRLIIDGEKVSDLKGSIPFKYELNPGEHYVQVITINNTEKNEIVTIESGKQKVLKYEFKENKDVQSDIIPILITNSAINIPGLMSEDNSTYYYAFEKDDLVLLNIDMSNAKGTNEISFYAYPSGDVKYSNSNFQDLNNVKIQIKERSIYGIKLKSNHTFDRDATLKIERIPSSNETKEFNTQVILKEFYEAIPIVENQKFFINSGSNATLTGGKSRITIPFAFPANTVKWFYNFSASRDESQIESVSKSMNLIADLTNLIDATGTISFGVESLAKPPGSDYCDIYLIDHDNYGPFLSKELFSHYPIGTRENFQSGVVEVSCCMDNQYYLGIKNPDNFHGIHVVVSISAVTLRKELVMLND